MMPHSCGDIRLGSGTATVLELGESCLALVLAEADRDGRQALARGAVCALALSDSCAR